MLCHLIQSCLLPPTKLPFVYISLQILTGAVLFNVKVGNERHASPFFQAFFVSYASAHAATSRRCFTDSASPICVTNTASPIVAECVTFLSASPIVAEEKQLLLLGNIKFRIACWIASDAVGKNRK